MSVPEQFDIMNNARTKEIFHAARLDTRTLLT